MTTCSDGHIVTQADLTVGIGRAQNAFKEIQAERLLPLHYKLKFVLDHGGVSSTRIIGDAEITVDPQFIACMSQQETKAILLHETGHIHQGRSTAVWVGLNVMLGVLCAGALTYKGILRPLIKFSSSKISGFKYFARHKVARNLVKMEHGTKLIRLWGWRKDLRNTLFDSRSYKQLWMEAALWTVCWASFWTVSGAWFFSRFANGERDADIYASRTMRSPEPMKSALRKKGQISVDSRGLQGERADTAYQNKMEAIAAFATFGPLKVLADPHMTVPERCAYLDKDYADTSRRDRKTMPAARFAPM